eukprot:COSAG04_NODE_831_length_10013_cov_78.138894_3_plen_73_part_00
MGENQDLINVGCKSTNNMVAPLDEPAPEWDPVKGIWKKSPAWFSSKTPVRHEIRTGLSPPPPLPTNRQHTAD